MNLRERWKALCDRINEYFAMQGLKRVVLVEKYKRPEPIDVRSFFISPEDPNLQAIVKNLRYVDVHSRDVDKIFACFRWLKDKIALKPDVGPDFWKMPQETLRDACGDCFDGAVLLANLMLAAGIAYWKFCVRIDILPGGSLHAYVTYFGKTWDWTGLNHTGKLWYCFNARNAYTTKERAREWK